jgi:hypothetical protein
VDITVDTTTTTNTAPAALPFGTALVGRTEKAFNAILQRQIEGTGLTEPLWVALTLAAASGGVLETAALAARLAAAQQTDTATAHGRLAGLAVLGFVRTTRQDTVELTPHGEAVWGGIRAAIGRITDGLWGDVPAPDLAAAARVLNTVLGRANGVLAA